MSGERTLSRENDADGVLALWVYLVVFLISALLLFFSHVIEHKAWSLFIQELGFAGIIALILIFTIEKFSRARHQRAADNLVREINENLFHAIYERYIPAEAFAEVEKTLLKAKVFRRNHEVTYTLTNLPDKSSGVECERHVECLAQSSYILENITSGEVEHEVTLNLEMPIDKGWIEYLKIRQVVINKAQLDQATVEKHTSDTSAQRRFSYPVKIPPGGRITVRTEATLVKRKLDQEIWTSRVPSDGLKLMVTIPSQDLEVFAHANHPEDLEITLNNDGTKKWELNFGMLPFQSIAFWWRTKEPLRCPIQVGFAKETV